MRKWFNHDPEKWTSFKAKYKTELKGSEALKELRALIKAHKTVTLLYGAKDEEHNHALALKQWLAGIEVVPGCFICFFAGLPEYLQAQVISTSARRIAPSRSTRSINRTRCKKKMPARMQALKKSF